MKSDPVKSKPRTGTTASLQPAPATDPPASWTEKTPGVCGGDARIRKTRITVWGLIEWRHLGLSDDEILERLPGLTHSDLATAWEYYDKHRDEIHEAIEENEAA